MDTLPSRMLRAIPDVEVNSSTSLVPSNPFEHIATMLLDGNFGLVSAHSVFSTDDFDMDAIFRMMLIGCTNERVADYDVEVSRLLRPVTTKKDIDEHLAVKTHWPYLSFAQLAFSLMWHKPVPDEHHRLYLTSRGIVSFRWLSSRKPLLEGIEYEKFYMASPTRVYSLA